MPGTCTDSSIGSDFGPTYMRSIVDPLKLPTAAPRTSTFTVSLGLGFCASRGTSIELRSVTIAAFCGSSGINTALKY